MAKNEIQILSSIRLQTEAGFGDPDARRNAEIRLQLLLAREQQRTASKLNWLTFLLVVVGVLQALILAFQVWHK